MDYFHDKTFNIFGEHENLESWLLSEDEKNAGEEGCSEAHGKERRHKIVDDREVDY